MAGQEGPAGEAPQVTYAVYSWEWKQDAPIGEIERAFDEMCAMGDPIPGVRQATWGRNAADDDHARGHTHAMVVIADDPESVHAYNERTSKHPLADLVHASEKSGIGIFFSRPA